MVVTLIYALNDTQLGERLAQDLARAGLEVSDTVQPGSRSLLVALISPDKDLRVQGAIEAALDNYQHIIPIVTAPTPLPKLISNLKWLDFSEGKYPLETLQQYIEQLSAPDAPRPMVALTPSRRRRNQRESYIYIGLALIMFVAGLYLVGVMGVQYPQVEYDILETARAQQRNAIIIPTLRAYLPRTTADALAFDSTVQALPTRLRPFIGATATSFILGSATPAPTWTPTGSR